MDPKKLSLEVDQNFDFFQRNLSKFLHEKHGLFALLRNQSVVDFYEKPGDAGRAGAKKFPDGIYSIQEVADEPVDLGLYSNATY